MCVFPDIGLQVVTDSLPHHTLDTAQTCYSQSETSTPTLLQVRVITTAIIGCFCEKPITNCKFPIHQWSTAELTDQSSETNFTMFSFFKLIFVLILRANTMAFRSMGWCTKFRPQAFAKMPKKDLRPMFCRSFFSLC